MAGDSGYYTLFSPRHAATVDAATLSLYFSPNYFFRLIFVFIAYFAARLALEAEAGCHDAAAIYFDAFSRHGYDAITLRHAAAAFATPPPPLFFVVEFYLLMPFFFFAISPRH